MENKPKNPFAKISTFATLKKLETDKNGRKLVIVDFTLGGGQFEEIDDLTAQQTEVMVTIQPSRRGTIYAGQDVSHRIVGDDYSYKQEAISELIIETSNAMRSRMLEKFAEGVTGWDNDETIEDVKLKIQKCVGDSDWVDALNLIMILRNLEKPIQEANEINPDVDVESEEGDPGLFDVDAEEHEESEETDFQEAFNEDTGNSKEGHKDFDVEKGIVEIIEINKENYEKKTAKELREMAKALEISGYSAMRKEELIEAIINDD